MELVKTTFNNFFVTPENTKLLFSQSFTDNITMNVLDVSIIKNLKNDIIKTWWNMMQQKMWTKFYSSSLGN